MNQSLCLLEALKIQDTMYNGISRFSKEILPGALEA
jgi:hypothetical protein